MKVLVFDTETAGMKGFSQGFIYNVAWIVADMEENGYYQILEKKEYMVKQVWYNTMLYSTAYYAEKKPLYHERIKAKEISVKPMAEVMEELANTISYHDVEIAYAYNSKFDVDMFNFNCDWFKVYNPLADIPVFDIRKFFILAVMDNDFYKEFCEEYQLFTESGNYSTTAETAYRYMLNDADFEEEHTALKDSEIELEILAYCAEESINIFQELPAPKGIDRVVEKTFTIAYKDKEYKFKGLTAKWYKTRNKLIIK